MTWKLIPVLLLAALPADAAVYLVTTTADTFDGICDHDCSLRDAVSAANALKGPDLIVLGPGVYELGIPGGGEDGGKTGDLDVTDGLVILGAGAKRTVLDGGGIDRVLDVRSGSLELHDLTVRNGWARRENESGGGIRSEAELRLLRVAVESNRADSWGGGISDVYSVTARDSTISGNSAVLGGGISSSVLDLENVTVSGNRADTGGGLFLPFYSALLSNVTITANDAPTAGGMYIDSPDCPFICTGAFELYRTVIAGNTGSNSPDCLGLPPHTGMLNLFGIGSGCLPQAGDVAGTTLQPIDPRLSPLGDHGGPTSTHLPLPGSPLIDFAPSCSAADQRGRPRPSGAGCDAGAVERLPGCQPDGETLCLGAGDRFRITAHWTVAGDSGPGKSLPLGMDTGAFWFFDPANVELTVKVLNGCGVNERWWVFLSGLTDVEVEVRVEDTKTGEIWTHDHAAGTPLQPRLDTDALEVCP